MTIFSTGTFLCFLPQPASDLCWLQKIWLTASNTFFGNFVDFTSGEIRHQKGKISRHSGEKNETLIPHSLEHHCFPFVIHLIWIYVAHLYDSPTIDYQSTPNIYPAEKDQNSQNPFGRKFEAYRIRAEISAWKHSGWIFSLRKIQVSITITNIVWDIIKYATKLHQQMNNTTNELHSCTSTVTFAWNHLPWRKRPSNFFSPRRLVHHVMIHDVIFILICSNWDPNYHQNPFNTFTDLQQSCCCFMF